MNKFNVWACGWCAGLAFAHFFTAHWVEGIICIILAIMNGVMGWEK